MQTTEMTVREAMRIAQKDTVSPHGIPNAQEREEWDAARRVLVKAGLCPSCACDGRRERLGKWQPGNYWEHAGRECLVCEEFVVCGEQPEYEPDPWMGDADPGL